MSTGAAVTAAATKSAHAAIARTRRGFGTLTPAGGGTAGADGGLTANGESRVETALERARDDWLRGGVSPFRPEGATSLRSSPGRSFRPSQRGDGASAGRRRPVPPQRRRCA